MESSEAQHIEEPPAEQKKPRWKEILSLFLVFLKIGAFTFGGGYAMIPLIRETVVEKKKWLTEEELLEVIAIAESTPGPMAINLATFVGYKKEKILGSLAATIGVILPSLLLIYVISLFLEQFLENKYVAYAFVGVRAAVAILILFSGFDMVRKSEKKLIPILCLIGTTIAMVLLEFFQINFSAIYFILIGAAIGLIQALVQAKKDKRLQKEGTHEEVSEPKEEEK